MSLSKKFWNYKSNKLAFTAVLMWLIPMGILKIKDNMFLGIVLLTVGSIGVFILLVLIFQWAVLKIEIKNNNTEVKCINIDYYYHLKVRQGFRQGWAIYLYGYKIKGSNRNYYYFYKDVICDIDKYKKNDFLNKKTIVFEYYKFSKVIKKIKN